MARYSLNYYESLFPDRGPGWEELVEALAQELGDYAREVSEGCRVGWGAADLARVRHSHRPLVVNLELHALTALEANLTTTLGTKRETEEATAFVTEALALAQALRSELPGRPPT